MLISSWYLGPDCALYGIVHIISLFVFSLWREFDQFSIPVGTLSVGIPMS